MMIQDEAYTESLFTSNNIATEYTLLMEQLCYILSSATRWQTVETVRKAMGNVERLYQELQGQSAQTHRSSSSRKFVTADKL